jgi:hypothetical protein
MWRHASEPCEMDGKVQREGRHYSQGAGDSHAWATTMSCKLPVRARNTKSRGFAGVEGAWNPFAIGEVDHSPI